MSFATKLSYIEYADGSSRDVMKLPKTDEGKVSLPGLLRVKKDPQTGLETVLSRDPKDASYDKDDLLRLVYDMKPIPGVFEDFTTVRARVNQQWGATPKHHDNISPALRQKAAAWGQKQREMLASDQV
jgi:nicotinamide phosphoribosyltransferase